MTGTANSKSAWGSGVRESEACGWDTGWDQSMFVTKEGYLRKMKESKKVKMIRDAISQSTCVGRTSTEIILNYSFWKELVEH